MRKHIWRMHSQLCNTSPEFASPLKVTIDWIDVPLQKERGPNGVETRTKIWLEVGLSYLARKYMR